MFHSLTLVASLPVSLPCSYHNIQMHSMLIRHICMRMRCFEREKGRFQLVHGKIKWYKR